MSGFATELNEKDLKAFQSVLNRIGKAALNKDLWEVVGAVGESQIKFNISDQKISVDDGSKWKELDPEYKKRKEQKRPGIGILEYDGYLWDSIAFDATDTGVEIGSPLIYAGIQHTMRPFVGLTDYDELERVVLDWVQGEANG